MASFDRSQERRDEDLELDLNMASEVSTLFGTNQGCGSLIALAKNNISDFLSINYLGIRIPNVPFPDDQTALASGSPNENIDDASTVLPPLTGSAPQQELSQRPQQMLFAPNTALNTTKFPYAVGLSGHRPSPTSTPSASSSTGRQSSAVSSHTSYNSTLDGDVPSQERSSGSVQDNVHYGMSSMHLGPPTQRRKSDQVELGSARAIHLEKNRKAASKCRSKQKKQQEELVQTARNAENKNRVLKAEVELLKSDMRDLMEIVGQHTQCPDDRLRTYVQREADRLAGAGSMSPSAHQDTSPKHTSSPEPE